MGDMAWYIPLLIFCARICDVAVGTIRMIFVIHGRRWIAAGLGFIEVLIWVLAVGGALHYLDSPIALIAYAGGFAMGTLVGMAIDDKIALGYRIIRVINADRSLDVSATLRAHGYRVTRIEGSGRDGPVEIVFSVVRRRGVYDALDAVRGVAPDAFVSVERADHASGGAFADQARGRRVFGRLGGVRK